MRQIIDTPKASLLAGCVLAVVLLIVRLVAADSVEVFAFLVRLLHVLAAMVWVGLIVFVNFVQLIALQGADDQVRGFFAKSVIPQVAAWYRHASTLAVATGAILLVTSGYLFCRASPTRRRSARHRCAPRCCGPACWAGSPCGCSCTCTSGRTCR